MRSLDRTLQDRPEALNALRVVNTVYPFFFRVIDRAMLIAKPSQLRVSPPFVRGNSRAASHVGDDMRRPNAAASSGSSCASGDSANLRRKEALLTVEKLLRVFKSFIPC